MANRRMFSKKITNSSEFLMMSPSAQALYFHLGMNADDDGICELFTIMRMTDSKPDDINALHSRGFVYVIDSKVVIIKDWHENNLIRQDRYEPSKHLKEARIADVYNTIMPKVLPVGVGMTDFGLPMVNQRSPEVRLGKDRLGKDNKKKTFNNVKNKKLLKELDKIKANLSSKLTFPEEEASN